MKHFWNFLFGGVVAFMILGATNYTGLDWRFWLMALPVMLASVICSLAFKNKYVGIGIFSFVVGLVMSWGSDYALTDWKLWAAMTAIIAMGIRSGFVKEKAL